MNARRLVHRGLHGLHQRLAQPHAERTAHEIERLDRDHYRCAIKRAARGDQCFLSPGFGAGIFQPIGVALLVAEFQRIGDHRRHRQFVIRTGIERPRETLLRADAHMKAALRANELRSHEIVVENHLAATRTFGPEIFRRFGFAPRDPILDLRANEVCDPVHTPTLTQFSRAPHAPRPQANDRIPAFRIQGFRGCRHWRHFSPRGPQSLSPPRHHRQNAQWRQPVPAS